MSDLAEFLLARVAEDETAATEELAMPAQSFLGKQWHDVMRRMVAECEAKRRIVAEHAQVGVYDWNTHGRCSTCSGASDEPHWSAIVGFPCTTLRALALPFIDHSDFDPAWRL